MDGDPTGTVDINDLTIVLADSMERPMAPLVGWRPAPEPGAARTDRRRSSWFARLRLAKGTA